MRHGGVGIAHKYFRMIADQIEIEVRQQPDRLFAADRGDNALDARIGKRPMEIVGAGLWVTLEPFGGAQGMRRWDQPHAKGRFKLPLARRIALRKHRRPTPR